MLLKSKGKRKTRLLEDHNDTVRDMMLEEKFFRDNKFKINYRILWRENQSFFESQYAPTPADFKKDFHIDENGKKRKA